MEREDRKAFMKMPVILKNIYINPRAVIQKDMMEESLSESFVIQLGLLLVTAFLIPDR